MLHIKPAYVGTIFTASIIILLAVGCNLAQNHSAASRESTSTPSAYQYLLDTEIRGIAPNIIEGYLNGEGLGMALPAELNGYPGPRHILDLADDLELSETQTKQIQSLFDEMQGQAIAFGKQIVAKEANLEQAFREKTIDKASLQKQLTSLGELQTQLRYVHLRTHLTTIKILSQHQIELYNTLRGYKEMPADHQHNHQHN